MNPRSPLAYASLALSACGALPGTPKGPASSAPSGPGSAGPSASARPTATPRTPTTGLEPVNTRTLEKDGNTYTLTLYPLVRDGAETVLTVQISYDKVTRSSNGELVGILSDGDQFSSMHGFANGFKLLDMGTRKLYGVAVYDRVMALCSPTLRRPSAQGDRIEVSCTYLDVPQSTQKMTVLSHHFGRFDDVPVR